jgi:hypothetical protein
MDVLRARKRHDANEELILDFATTASIFCAALLMFGLASWRASRPAQFGKVRMIPWTSLIIVFAVIAILMLVHLVNLAGITTGQNRSALR